MVNIDVRKIKTTYSRKHGKKFAIYEFGNKFVLSANENKTHRKLFKAFLHQSSDETRLEGQIICQRKSQKDEWEDVQKILLNKMKAGEEISIDLKSEEVAALSVLLDEIHKIKPDLLKAGSVKFVNTENIIEINDKNYKEIIQQLINKNYSKDVLSKIIERDFDLAKVLIKSAIQKERERELREFEKMLKENCSDETGKWQPFFKRCKWIFGLGLDYKFLSKMKRELKTGLGDEDNKGQSFADFGLGVLDEYSVLVELKTPNAEIFMASEGDSNTWKISEKLVNSLVQILSQKTAWVSNYNNKFPVDPRCILVYGRISQIDNEIKKTTFEMFRRDSRNIEIIAYDELFKRAYYIVYGKSMPDNYL